MERLSTTMIIIGGFYNLGFGIFHLTFWRIFNWKKDLARLTRINRAIMQILNLCLTLFLFIMAYVSFFHTSELVTTGLGKTILMAFSLFWFLRMIEQVIFFGLKKLVSVILTLIFLLGGLIYLIPLLI